MIPFETASFLLPASIQHFLQYRFVIFVGMNHGFTHLTTTQRLNAIQRLTALWAFTESGLGGIMHALKIPFTGLLVGGMAIIMITLIAKMSDHQYRQVLRSAVIVLIVKAMVSPHTPFPAYIAVSFQAVLGYAVFSLLRINFFSIALLSTIAMLESAIQKLLILTLFFGKSLWAAMDEMIALIAKQFGNTISNGSYWIISVYLLIYLAGGLLTALFAYRIIKNFSAESRIVFAEISTGTDMRVPATKPNHQKNTFKRLWILILLMIGLSAILFVFAADHTQGWLAVAKTITWTLSAILIWFLVIGPVFTKALQKLLIKKQSRYSADVMGILSFLPVLRQLTVLAWQQSKVHRGLKRGHFFFTAIIHTTLTYAESTTAEMPLNNTA